MHENMYIENMYNVLKNENALKIFMSKIKNYLNLIVAVNLF